VADIRMYFRKHTFHCDQVEVFWLVMPCSAWNHRRESLKTRILCDVPHVLIPSTYTHILEQ